MSNYPEIEFYDISCTTTTQPWSPFTARTYLALRLLEIPFTRHMVPMAQIGSKLSAVGLPKPESGRYTLPAITITTAEGKGQKEWMTESKEIAEFLHRLYLEQGGELSKSLFPNEASREAVKNVGAAFRASLYSEGDRWKNIVPRLCAVLEPESQAFFNETRIGDWGKLPQEILDTDAKENEQRDGGPVKVYIKVLEPIAELYQDKGGMWQCGERPVYADLTVLAALQWFKIADPDVFHKALKEVGGGLEKAWLAGQELFAKK